MHRTTTIAHLAPTLTLLASMAGGCDVYYDTVASSGVTNTTFDSTLPDALETVFAECTDPISLTSETETIDLAGDCSLGDFDEASETTLVLGLASLGELELGGPIFPAGFESHLNDIYLFEGFPWPIQGCKVYMETAMDFGSIRMTDLQSSWTTRSSSPSLHIDFDFTPTYNPWTHTWSSSNDVEIAEGEIDSEVDCPNPLNELFIQPLLPEGDYEIELENMDLDLWVKLDHDGADVTAELDVRVNIGSIELDPPLNSTLQSYVGTFEEVLEDAGSTSQDSMDLSKEGLEELFEDNLTAALAEVASGVEQLVEDAVPAGHTICSIEVDGGELVMVTDDESGPLTCMRMIRRRF